MKNFFKKLRYRVVHFILIRCARGKYRNKKFFNLNMAKTIGIVYVLDSYEVQRSITRLVNKLKSENKEVKALGIVKSKKDTKQYLPKLSFDYIYPKNVNLSGKPFGKYYNNFVKKDFDILIDCTNDDLTPVLFILALSRAKMKIGGNSSKINEFYDVIISKKDNTNLDSHIENVYHYLKIINK